MRSALNFPFLHLVPNEKKISKCAHWNIHILEAKDSLKLLCFGSEGILQQHFKSNRMNVSKIVSVKSVTVNDYAKKRPTKDHRTLLMDVNKPWAAIHLVCLIVYFFIGNNIMYCICYTIEDRQQEWKIMIKVIWTEKKHWQYWMLNATIKYKFTWMDCTLS